MVTNIPSNPTPAASTPSSNSVSSSLPAGTSLWLKIANIQPIGAELRTLANQTLINALAARSQMNTLLGTALNTTSAKGLMTTMQLANTQTPLANNPINAGQLSTLLEAKQLFLIQAQLRSQPVSLITDQNLKIGTQIQVQTSAQGLQLLTKQEVDTSTQPNKPTLLNSDKQPSTLTSTDRNTLNALLRKALPLQQSSANSVKSLDILLSKILSSKISNQSTAASSEKLLITTLQKLTQTLPINSNAQTLKNAINNSGVFSEAKLSQLLQTQNPNVGNTTPVPADTKQQLWHLFAQLSAPNSANPTGATNASSPAVKDAGLMQQLLNLLGISITQNATLGATKTNIKQALTEVGKQWLAKITAQQLANLVDEPDTQTLKNLTIELPVRNEQQVTPLQLQFSKFWHYEEDEKNGSPSEKSEKKREVVWQVTLSINVEKLGTIDARIRYINQHLQCSLWAEQATTLELIEKEASQLTQAIQRKGLAVEPIHCHAGRMPSPTNKLSQPLLDTHA